MKTQIMLEIHLGFFLGYLVDFIVKDKQNTKKPYHNFEDLASLHKILSILIALCMSQLLP